jgi:type 2 lantibiotic biosynthesis protein LanM
MDTFFERLVVRAATIDELLSNDFEQLPGQKGDADIAARRLAAWCRAAASGDWSLFVRRLERDRLSLAEVLPRLATVRRGAAAPASAWIDDAIWIEAALRAPAKHPVDREAPDRFESRPFETLFTALIEQAETRLWSGVNERVRRHLNENARATLRHALLTALSSLCAPALYERFTKARKDAATLGSTDARRAKGALLYDRFIADMKASGMRRLFEDKPVLLRLLAVNTRQWIDTTCELLLRLDADIDVIRRDILHTGALSPVAAIEGDLSDPHNGGHSVQIVSFEDGTRVVYKPKDLRLDAAWHALVGRLNAAGAPVELRAAHAIAGDGYGWTEFIGHTGCAGADGVKRFFRRGGAWLALFHLFAGSDMHQENMIAASDHPVPIDLEMILQAAAEENRSHEAEAEAFEAAMETVANSVMMVGLLPAYSKSPENKIFAVGGVKSGWTALVNLTWNGINSDEMRPVRAKQAGESLPNLPHIGGQYAKFGDHIDDFIAGFQDYSRFLMRLSRDAKLGDLFADFVGLPVRKVIRPTRFYYMLLQRLKNHRTMDDGIIWSMQADFLARLADWERDTDLLWPLQRSERQALWQLNVPHFVSPSDSNEVTDAAGIAVRTGAIPGVARARARLESFDERELAWQIAVIRQNTATVTRSGGPMAAAEPRKLTRESAAAAPTREIFVAEAGNIAAELARYAVRRGPGAAWIGLDWLGDSEVAQLVALGPDLYNGTAGIAIFLAAHASVAGHTVSRELALAAVANLRKSLKGRNAARIARSLGIGGACGLGSIVYAFALMADFLHDKDLLADAHSAAALLTDDLIAADTLLDILGGSAGAILALLRLYRDSQSADALKCAIKCGGHLLAQPRIGPDGHRSWVPLGIGEKPLNGMSHGAAGFAYALACLAAATGREDFADAAAECVALEDSRFDSEHSNWPDLRAVEPSFPCQWCHGAPGIGLARIALGKQGAWNGAPRQLAEELLSTDVRNALAGVERGWPNHVDTMCCGTLGSIEFLCEAAGRLGRDDLRDLATRRMLAVVESAAAGGDYRFNVGGRQFNLGLFRGLAGVGYTCLRQADASLPNILIWD